MTREKNEKELMNRFHLLLKKSDLEKISMETNKDNNERVVVVNVHNLGTKDAKILLTNVIALNKEGFTIEVIHGYNHGTAIKEMIGSRLNSSRIKEIKGCAHNPGVTFLMTSALGY